MQIKSKFFAFFCLNNYEYNFMDEQTKQNNIELNEEELKEYFRVQGEKLGLLLASSNLPQQVKEDIIAIVPNLNLEQLNELVNIFENKFADEATKSVDEQFDRDIKRIIKESDKKAEVLNREYKKKLDDFEEEIENLNKKSTKI